MNIEEGRRIIDQTATSSIADDDVLIIDSSGVGSRKITYKDLCAAVAVTLGISDIKSTADGAMQKNAYDTDGNGRVDDADKVNGHSVESDVPADAVFTDTVYDDYDVKKSVTDEAERAAKAEGANAQAITDETSRAKKAEEANAGAITKKMEKDPVSYYQVASTDINRIGFSYVSDMTDAPSGVNTFGHVLIDAQTGRIGGEKDNKVILYVPYNMDKVFYRLVHDGTIGDWVELAPYSMVTELSNKLQNYGLTEQLLRNLPHGTWNVPKWVKLFTFEGIGTRVQQYVTLFYTDNNYGDAQYPRLASILGYNSTSPWCLTRDLVNATAVSDELGYVINSDGKTEVYMLLKNYAVPSVGFFIAYNVTIDCQTLVYDEPEGIKYF